MTSEPGWYTFIKHILPNISRSKHNQTMKFGQLIQYKKRNIFLQKSCKNETGRLVPDLFLFFRKALYEVKASVVCNLVSIYFDSAQLDIQ